MGTVYIKKDGVTTKVEEPCITNSIFRPQKVDAMELLRGIPPVKGNDRLYINSKKMLEIIKKDAIDKYVDMINRLTIKIVNMKSLDELDKDSDSILNVIINTYMQNKRSLNNTYNMIKYYDYEMSVIKKSIKEDNSSAMTAIVKDIIKRYVHIHIYSMNSEEIEKAYKDVASGGNPLDYIFIDGISANDLEDDLLKELISKIAVPEIKNKYDDGFAHLCFDCVVPICECPKILDQVKRNISEYDFITDGKQLTHSEKVVLRTPGPDMVMRVECTDAEMTDELLVTKCKKFIKSKGRK